MRTGLLVVLSTLILPLAISGAELETNELETSELVTKARAVVPAASHDLGELTPGETASHGFEIENQGDAPLELERLGMTGPCTMVDWPRTVAPGEKGLLRVGMDTSTLTKPVRCSFRLASNDPERPALDFELGVAQRAVIKAKPGQARFQYVQGEPVGSIRQVLWAADATPFTVLTVTAPGQLETTFRRAGEAERKSDQAGDQWVVEIAIRGDAPVGPIEGGVEVRTDHPVQKVFRLPVSGFVRPVLHVTPPEGEIVDLELLRDTIVPFTVRNFATEPIHLLEARSSLPGTRTEIVAREEGRSWEVRVILTPQMGSGEFAGELTILTDSAKAPRVEVPLFGQVTVPASAPASPVPGE
jgi:hypothetical protein